MAFIYQDRFNQKRYITSRLLKNKLITLEGKEYDNEGVIDLDDNANIIGFLEKIEITSPKILDFYGIQDLITKKISNEDLESFLPLFTMERINFLCIVYLLNENLVTTKEIQKLIAAPFYSRSEYLIRYLSRETEETIKHDFLFNKFYSILESTSPMKYLEKESFAILDSYHFPNLSRAFSLYELKMILERESQVERINLPEEERIIDMFRRKIGISSWNPLTREKNIILNTFKIFEPLFQKELAKIVDKIFENRLDNSRKQSSSFFEENIRTSLGEEKDSNLYEHIEDVTFKMLKNMIRPDVPNYYDDSGKYIDYVKLAYDKDLNSFMTSNLTDFSFIENEKLRTFFHNIFSNFEMPAQDNIFFDSLSVEGNFSSYFIQYFSSGIYNTKRAFMTSLINLDMIIEEDETGGDLNRVKYINSEYLADFKNAILKTMEELNIPALDLEDPELKFSSSNPEEFTISSYLELLINSIEETEDNKFKKNIGNINSYESSLTCLFYLDILKRYLMYLKGEEIEDENDILFVSSSLFKDYRVLSFVQQSFAIFDSIYTVIKEESSENYINYYNILRVILSLDPYVPPTQSLGNKTGGGGGGKKELATLDVFIK